MRYQFQNIIQCFGGGLFFSVSALITTTTTPTQLIERESKMEKNKLQLRYRDYKFDNKVDNNRKTKGLPFPFNKEETFHNGSQSHRNTRLLMSPLENVVFPFFFSFLNKSVALCEQVVPKSTTSSAKLSESKPESTLKAATEIIEYDVYQDNALYERIDLKMMKLYGDFTKDHLIHESLNAEDKIADMKVYRNIETNEVIVTCKMGNKISGHPGIVHGGSTAALLDNSFGYGFFATNVGNGFTANLNINYRAPISCGSSIVLSCRATKIEGRKVYLSAEIRDQHNHDKLYVESTCLFITSSKLQTIEKKI